MPEASRKKWQRPKLSIYRKSEEERRLLERASLLSLPCPVHPYKLCRCYTAPARSPSKN